MVITWKKGLFSNTYELFNANNRKIGELKKHWFNSSAEGYLDDQKIQFTKTDIFSKTIKITYQNNTGSKGKITTNTFRTKTKISLKDQVYQLAYLNFWKTKWGITDGENTLASYHYTTFKGSIEYQTMNEELILSGLFGIDYYKQIAAAIASSIIIVITIQN